MNGQQQPAWVTEGKQQRWAPAAPIDRSREPRQTPTGAPASDSAAPAAPKAAKKIVRDRYLDLLRAIALFRVVLLHTFGWWWLPLVFPSMGVMFALAGSLMARSLSRPAPGVVKSRMRRLLPPVWMLALAVVPLGLLYGWDPGEDGGFSGWLSMLNFIVPVGAPPFPQEAAFPGGFLESGWLMNGVEPLWYLRTYLWLVVLSPLLLPLFRRMPLPVMLLPLVVVAAMMEGWIDLPGELGNSVFDTCVYAACWMLGFAHNDGLLKRIPRYILVSCASFAMGAALWWYTREVGFGTSIEAAPLANALWSLGAVAILLTYSPSWEKLPGRLAAWDRLVTLANNRAVTIYLWHNLAIAVSLALLNEVWGFSFLYDAFGHDLSSSFGDTYQFWAFALAWPLIFLAIACFGWVEDIAARRKPRLWPTGPSRRERSRASAASGSPGSPGSPGPPGSPEAPGTPGNRSRRRARSGRARR
ncbi:acyltransferase family protein [Streptomyces sp. KLOTTS4A1]|uniref:acyltransferase family protein n=1 Tax=Streptomyces sp. KLOTTS4A1 TaxID=3390996 RepID=UPI0039F5FA6D